VRRATVEEVEFGRVLCACGGTCDPSDETLRHLDARREREGRLTGATAPQRGRKTMKTGSIVYQAQIYRHGRPIDYGTELRDSEADAESDLRDCLGMMSESEQEQATVESHVQRWRVLGVDENGEPDLVSA
jgi:hypothetical protein